MLQITRSLSALCLAALLAVPASAQEGQGSTPQAGQNPAGTAESGTPAQSIPAEQLKKSLDDMFSTMGTAIGGMAQGLRQSAKDIQGSLDGADGATLVQNSDELLTFTQTRVLRSEQQGDGTWTVTLAIKNPGEKPLKLVNLTDRKSVLLLDSEGFVHEALKGLPRTLDVPERAAVKLVVNFSSLDGLRPGLIRLYGLDIAIEGTPRGGVPTDGGGTSL